MALVVRVRAVGFRVVGYRCSALWVVGLRNLLNLTKPVNQARLKTR